MFHFHSKQEVTLPTYTQRELHFPVSSLIGYSAGAPICQMVEIVWLQLCSLVGFPDSSVGKEFAWFNSWLRKICWRRDRIPTPVFLSFPCGSAGKESTCNVGDLGPIPGLGRSPEEGKSYPHQYSGLENSMDCIVHGAAKSWTWLSYFQFHLTFFCSLVLNSTAIHSNVCIVMYSSSLTLLLHHAAAAAVKLLQSCPTLCDPIDGSPQIPPSLGFSRQEHGQDTYPISTKDFTFNFLANPGISFFHSFLPRLLC